jgi:hypothetical protein
MGNGKEGSVKKWERGQGRRRRRGEKGWKIVLRKCRSGRGRE